MLITLCISPRSYSQLTYFRLSQWLTVAVSETHAASIFRVYACTVSQFHGEMSAGTGARCGPTGAVDRGMLSERLLLLPCVFGQTLHMYEQSLILLRPWRWRQYVLPKYRQHCLHPHGARGKIIEDKVTELLKKNSLHVSICAPEDPEQNLRHISAPAGSTPALVCLGQAVINARLCARLLAHILWSALQIVCVRACPCVASVYSIRNKNGTELRYTRH
jgi:hypothetical protein